MKNIYDRSAEIKELKNWWIERYKFLKSEPITKRTLEGLYYGIFDIFDIGLPDHEIEINFITPTINRILKDSKYRKIFIGQLNEKVN